MNYVQFNHGWDLAARGGVLSIYDTNEDFRKGFYTWHERTAKERLG
jgi:hypothetical protein